MNSNFEFNNDTWRKPDTWHFQIPLYPPRFADRSHSSLSVDIAIKPHWFHQVRRQNLNAGKTSIVRQTVAEEAGSKILQVHLSSMYFKLNS